MDHAVAKNNIYLQRKEKRTLLHKKIWRTDFNYRVKLQRHIGEMLCVLNPGV